MRIGSLFSGYGGLDLAIGGTRTGLWSQVVRAILAFMGPVVGGLVR